MSRGLDIIFTVVAIPVIWLWSIVVLGDLVAEGLSGLWLISATLGHIGIATSASISIYRDRLR